MTTAVQTLVDPMDPARARALQATLGESPTLATGDPLPPFFHQVYFWGPELPSNLGRDGHPKVGGVIPDMGLPRRMWAGGRLGFDKPLLAGVPTERRTFVENTAHKSGRTGPLGFVTMRHEYWQNGACATTEWQDLVYREDPKPEHKIAPPVAMTDEDQCNKVRFDTTMLFRYSALTFNGHRIHYDQDYASRVEGYDGLVVHGPLLAQMLMLLAERNLGGLKTFAFRSTSPLVHTETAELCWSNSGKLWVRGPDGRQVQVAEAT